MLLGVAFVVLLVSGIGIMNIMLATVSARIREIGIRKALGATNREIRFQFLCGSNPDFCSGGGLVGVVIGLAIPYSVRFLTEYRIPISGLSAIVAILVSSLVGVVFGTVPATRAARSWTRWRASGYELRACRGTSSGWIHQQMRHPETRRTSAE